MGNRLNNQRGQMAVFVALFFQVIFVFFAMAINVGLVVHDKINLQNAVDFAAYYGSMKQAEVLNQIAHINYQMRQNYKLFVWRYRVLGTIGNKAHPLNYLSPGYPGVTLRNDVPAWDETVPPNSPVYQSQVIPSVCIANSYFQETKDLDPGVGQVCRDNGWALPAVPSFAAPTGLVPGSGNLPGAFAFLQQQLSLFCLEASVFNWLYAARIYAHYRSDGYLRKQMIHQLRLGLTGPTPRDIKGESIEDGVRQTFMNNLTNTNAASIQQGTGEFQYLNSLQNGQCGDPYFWLPEIKITPSIFFSNWDIAADGACGNACPVPNRNQSVPCKNPSYSSAGLQNLPSAFGMGIPQFNAWLGAPVVQRLRYFWAGEPPPIGNQIDDHSSIGFEKNPWCMMYTGVQARTVVRKPFDPLGTGVELRARGFAKPFGGRIGPWYGKTWSPGTPYSSVNSPDDKVDPLLPAREGAGTSTSSLFPFDDVASYSRFPGDQNGANSMEYLSAFSTQLVNTFNHHTKDHPSPVAVANYDHIGSRSISSDHKDPLARTGITRGNALKPPLQRPFELAAVGPDPFDAIYYSVEPLYYDNYFTSRPTNSGAIFPPTGTLWDIGSSSDNGGGSPGPLPGPPPIQDFSIRHQVDFVNGTTANSGSLYDQGYPHIIRDWKHLLTSWHQRTSTDYTLDPNRFGFCYDNGDIFSLGANYRDKPTTGSCLRGGRTGYGVKLISRDYLDQGSHRVGGGSGVSGQILNPPSNFGF